MNEKLKNVAEALTNLANTILALTAVSEAQEEAKPLKIEDVRSVLAKLSSQGKTSEMKALLSQFGANTLSDVDPANYAELLIEAQKIAEAVNA